MRNVAVQGEPASRVFVPVPCHRSAFVDVARGRRLWRKAADELQGGPNLSLGITGSLCSCFRDNRRLGLGVRGTKRVQWALAAREVLPGQRRDAMAFPLSITDQFRSNAIPTATRLLPCTSLEGFLGQAVFWENPKSILIKNRLDLRRMVQLAVAREKRLRGIPASA